MNWLSYYRPTHNARYCNTVVGFFNSPDVMSWVCHNDVGLLWNWYQPSAWWQGSCNIIVNDQQDIRFSDTHNASHAWQPLVSRIPYGQDIPMPDFTIVNCLQDIIFSETCNGSQPKLPSVSLDMAYTAFHIWKTFKNQLHCQIIYITGLDTNKGSTPQLSGYLTPGNIICSKDQAICGPPWRAAL